MPVHLENGNGNSGGEINKGLLSQLPSLSGNGGENGAAGGGGGFIGGKAGEYILHHHTESCYTDENLTAGESWYKAATSWFSYDGWGEQTHLEADHVCIEHWGWEDSHCIQNISSAQFATPHAGTLTFHIVTDTTRATDLGTTTIAVKNQAGEYIYTKAFTGEVYGENADPGFVKNPDDPNASYTRKDGDWYHDYCDGWHDGWYWREFSATNYSGYARTWNKHSCEDADGNWTGDDAKAYVSLDFTVPLTAFCPLAGRNNQHQHVDKSGFMGLWRTYLPYSFQRGSFLQIPFLRLYGRRSGFFQTCLWRKQLY